MEYSKYFLYKKQVSYDAGETWEDTDPLETTTSGDPIATYETLAECESGTPKFYATYSDGTSYLIDCTSTGDTLTSADTRGHSTAYSAMTEAVIGGCVSNIGLIPTYEEDVPKPFIDCTSLSSVTISNSVTLIGEDAFYGCTNLPNIIIPDSVTEIGGAAFYLCSSLSSVTLSNSIVRLSGSLFGGCDSITSVGKIGSGASVEIPNSVTVIDPWCFGYSNYIESINLPDSITSIGDGAFKPQVNFNNLKTVVIGSGITDIYDAAFENNNGLLSITIKATVPPTLNYGRGGGRLPMPFENTNNCPIYVPSGSVNQFKNAQFWDRYASRIQAIP